MSEFLTSDPSGAIPNTPVSAATLPHWLDEHPRSREWISVIGFKAEPGTFAFVPGATGRPEAVIASPTDGAPVYAFAELPTALPEGKYTLDLSEHDSSPIDAALGWALASYAFNASKKPKRAPAPLVCPANADQGEVERISSSVFLARDMINTPAEDMGPQHLADSAKKVADTHGATIEVISGEDLLRQNYPTIYLVGRHARALRVHPATARVMRIEA